MGGSCSDEVVGSGNDDFGIPNLMQYFCQMGDTAN